MGYTQYTINNSKYKKENFTNELKIENTFTTVLETREEKIFTNFVLILRIRTKTKVNQPKNMEIYIEQVAKKNITRSYLPKCR